MDRMDALIPSTQSIVQFCRGRVDVWSRNHISDTTILWNDYTITVSFISVGVLINNMTENTTPKIEVDFGIAAVNVEGGEEDSLSDVHEVFKMERDKLIEDIGDLKREDFEIQDNYDQLPQQSGNGVSSTFN